MFIVVQNNKFIRKITNVYVVFDLIISSTLTGCDIILWGSFYKSTYTILHMEYKLRVVGHF